VLGSLFVGGGPGTAKTVLGRLLQTAAKEAFVNGAHHGVMQPASRPGASRQGCRTASTRRRSNVLFGRGARRRFRRPRQGRRTRRCRLLQRVAPALPAEARGALDAAEQLQALDQVRRRGVAGNLRPPGDECRRRGAGRAVPLSPDVPDEVEVNRIVNALAPAPESISGKIEPRSDASIDACSRRSPTRARRPGAPTPISIIFARLGGVDPKSPAPRSCAHAGVTAKSVYRKGGLRASTTCRMTSCRRRAAHDRRRRQRLCREDALVQAAGGEAGGFGAGRTVDDAAASATTTSARASISRADRATCAQRSAPSTTPRRATRPRAARG
jgi:hypothetical protein